MNLFDRELQLINTKPMIKNNMKELLSELKKFKFQAEPILECKKRNDCKTFHWSANIIACVSEIDEAFICMYQSNMRKIKNYSSKNCQIVLIVGIKDIIKIFTC